MIVNLFTAPQILDLSECSLLRGQGRAHTLDLGSVFQKANASLVITREKDIMVKCSGQKQQRNHLGVSEMRGWVWRLFEAGATAAAAAMGKLRAKPGYCFCVPEQMPLLGWTLSHRPGTAGTSVTSGRSTCP